MVSQTKRAFAADEFFTQVYTVGSFFVYSLLLISLVDTSPSPTAVQLTTWLLATLLEDRRSDRRIHAAAHRDEDAIAAHAGTAAASPPCDARSLPTTTKQHHFFRRATDMAATRVVK